MRSALTAAALAALVALTGCSTDAGTTAERESDTQTTNTPADPPADAADPADTPAAPAAEDVEPAEGDAPPSGARTFDEAVEYEDGLKVEIAKVERGRASEWASGAEQTDGLMAVLTVRITNGGTEPFDAALVSMSASYGEAGETAEQVFDTENGIEGFFQGSILPGKAKTVKAGFAVPKDGMKDLTVEVSPDPFTKDAAIFTGKVG